MTKLTFLISILLALSMSCNSGHSNGQSFNTNSIDIKLDIKELVKPATKVELTHAVKYKDEFYCFFEEVKEDNLTPDMKFCFVFSDNSKKIRKIEVPKEIQENFYYDLFIKNDNVFIKTYMESETLYFDREKSKWVNTKNADDLIYEDEKFYVYSLDFGEWGGKTWFKDKKTGIEYEIEVITPLVNRIDTTYYLTSSFNILKIKNPLALNKCDYDVTYENIEKDAKYTFWYGKPIGFEIVYEDTTKDNYFKSSNRPHIVSSFVWQNELLHIYETEIDTYIVRVENNSIKTIQNIGNKLRFYDRFYSYRNKILTDGQQLLKFKTNNKFGLLEINGQYINTYNLILQL